MRRIIAATAILLGALSSAATAEQITNWPPASGGGGGSGTITAGTTVTSGIASGNLIGSSGNLVVDSGIAYSTLTGGPFCPLAGCTYTGAVTFPNSDIKLIGSSTGSTTFTSANAGASNFTLTFPAATDTIADLAGTQTLTNKTIAFAFNTLTGVAPLASPTFTGTVTIPTPFTLGAVSVTSTGTQLNYLAAATGSTGTVTTNVVFSASPILTGTTNAATLNTSLTFSAAANSLTVDGVTGFSKIWNVGVLGWVSSNNSSTGTLDTTFCRQGAGIVEIGASTGCAASGSLLLTNLTMSGALQLGNAFQTGAVTTTGYLTVKDSNGTVYKFNACTGC